MSKLERLAEEAAIKQKRLDDEAAKTRNDNTPIEIEIRLREAKAELENLKPYLKTLARKPYWDEWQKSLRKKNSA
ncbi:hypothetical protein ALQ37_200055 [Pseudomonas syringae pv. aptata]|uniref:Uncharacterized protein n=1 Tax=Pseudomonas syringae pv. aptata TaxID=83167 RepID=A0A0Q0BTN2_PSEAP|nr:hypothetical protein [Pseudomonas syringae]KPY97955.1 Unknown protein sequence [Pseudomonas syringae pv. aptata]RMO65391.1 hypothetical protein ALQ37_200055 [Pseudomonas syringae pv. aptata]